MMNMKEPIQLAASMESDAYLVQFQFCFCFKIQLYKHTFSYINHIAYLNKILCNLAGYVAPPCTLFK